MFSALRQANALPRLAVRATQSRAMSAQHFSCMTTGTLKDASLKDAADAAVKDLKENVLTKTEGFVAAERHYCGGQQTFRLVTVWDSIDTLKAHGSADGYESGVAQLSGHFVGGEDGVHTQLFYYNKI
mmetsp:Transcript_104787/g.146063  ORF Transcript_104787/g.146063 Transcript_104787/m.146063 type:complete len:128 (-) Transcript_104787:38-421(-)